MGLPIVWGTRVKEEAVGIIAIKCPHCGELTVADCFKITSAQHVYFITGEYREAGKYAKCRLCGVPQDIPAKSRPMVNPHEDRVRPGNDLIEQTNPEAAKSAVSPLKPGLNIPASVARSEWALIQGIAEEIRRQDADDKLGGNIKPLYILTLMFAMIGGVFMWVELERKSKLIPFILLGLGTATLLVLIYWLEVFLLNRGLHRQVSRYVQANLGHTSSTMQSLVEASAAMGRNYRRITSYLKWARNRMESR